MELSLHGNPKLKETLLSPYHLTMEADDELLLSRGTDRAQLECSLSPGAPFWGWREVRRAEVCGKVKGVLQGARPMCPKCTDRGVNLGQDHS